MNSADTGLAEEDAPAVRRRVAGPSTERYFPVCFAASARLAGVSGFRCSQGREKSPLKLENKTLQRRIHPQNKFD
jgi:hypothetical protein